LRSAMYQNSKSVSQSHKESMISNPICVARHSVQTGTIRAIWRALVHTKEN